MPSVAFSLDFRDLGDLIGAYSLIIHPRGPFTRLCRHLQYMHEELLEGFTVYTAERANRIMVGVRVRTEVTHRYVIVASLFRKICGYDSVKSSSMPVRCSVQHNAIAD